MELQASRRSSGCDSQAIAHALFGLMAVAVRNQPRDMGLTSASTLATLELTGPRRLTDLAACEGVTQPSMTALVSALERPGLVERRRDPSDGRVALVALTTDGTAYVRARRQAGVDVFAQLLHLLPAHEVDALFEAVTAMTHIQQLDEERRSCSVGAPSPPVGPVHL